MTAPLVIVTGAAGHLGRAVVSAFGATGASLVLVDRSADALAEHFGRQTEHRILAATDLLDAAQVRATVSLAKERFGRIDVLCNLAGGFAMGPAVHETDEATWSRLFDLNVRTLLNMARAVVPTMLEQHAGRIVNVGAFSARRGAANTGAYIAAKSSVIRLTESMSAELRQSGVNVNCVLPSILDTPPNRADMPDADPSRWVAPIDLANVIVFLASDAARAVHGAAIPVTGLS